jgi:hypothetical protein
VRRAILLSLIFPVVAWFLAEWYGLFLGAAAAAYWWLATRPRALLWCAAAACLLATPFALWAQGLPTTDVAGATFGLDHWLANRLATAALILAAFAGLVDLLRLDFNRPGRVSRSRRLVWAILRRTERRFQAGGAPPTDQAPS